MNNSNNDCPPLMSDGRHATDWRTSCKVHEKILSHNKVCNSHKARIFLQEHATELMGNNSEFFKAKNTCNCTAFHVDPNGNDKYWAEYHKKIGYVSKKAD